jgi:hypothetical protein
LESRIGVPVKTAFVPEFITEDEARELRILHLWGQDPQDKSRWSEEFGGVVIPKAARDELREHPVMQRIVDYVRENHGPLVTLDAPSYCTTEVRASGHTLHDDRGISYTESSTGGGHMTWCRHSVTVLISPPDEFSGGEFYYDDASLHAPTPAEQYRALCYHTSDVKHGVLPHTGRRIVLLAFMADRTE